MAEFRGVHFFYSAANFSYSRMDVILRTLSEAIDANVDLSELDFIVGPCDASVVVADGGRALGLHHSCIKPMFIEAVSLFKQLNPNAFDSVDGRRQLDVVTKGIIVVKGDVPTALNCRKKLLQCGAISWDTEERFARLVISRHAKSPVLWYHREWCLTGAPTSMSITRELRLFAAACRRYPRNYFAWRHRLWLLKFMNDDEVEH